MTCKVIIDTDPGLDDAIAILFALGCGRFDVLGVTSVAGNIGIERTTANAGSLLRLMGRSDIPVATGAAQPLARLSIDEAAIHGSDGLGGVALPPPDRTPLPSAVAWLAEQLRAQPEHTTDILALGPLTNVATLIQTDPEAALRLRRVIAMGGVISDKGNVGPRSEFNFASDPEALVAVLDAGVDLAIIPLDVTRKVRASLDYLQQLRGTNHGDIAADLITAYLQDGRESRPLHDPCVMLYALEPETFGTEPMTLEVDLTKDPGAISTARGGRPATVAMTIDAGRALELLRTGFC